MAPPHIPDLGIGIGLRIPHYEAILKELPPIDWFEIISENFMRAQGRPRKILEKILEHYPVVQHGVNLAIGSPDSLDFGYLKQLKELAKFTKTPWISDHLCWGRLPGAHYHDLLPLPRTREVVDYVVKRAKIVQDYLELPFALENLSSYASFACDEMEEWDFYSTIVEQAGIYMMLDVNNIYVSSHNHGFDPYRYLDAIPVEKVIQIHIAGHQDCGTHLIDTHDEFVKDAVWQLYAYIYRKIYENSDPKTGISTLLERDDNILGLKETWDEALKAKEYQQSLQIAL